MLNSSQEAACPIGRPKNKRKHLKAAHPFSLGAGSSKLNCSHSAQGKPPPLVYWAIFNLAEAHKGEGRQLPTHCLLFMGPSSDSGSCVGGQRGRPPLPAWASWNPSESTERDTMHPGTLLGLWPTVDYLEKDREHKHWLRSGKRHVRNKEKFPSA